MNLYYKIVDDESVELRSIKAYIPIKFLDSDGYTKYAKPKAPFSSEYINRVETYVMEHIEKTSTGKIFVINREEYLKLKAS